MPWEKPLSNSAATRSDTSTRPPTSPTSGEASSEASTKPGDLPDRGVPRRSRLDLNTSAELAIRSAIHIVEGVGADVRLTDAVCLLGEALEAVADVVDGVRERRRRFLVSDVETDEDSLPLARNVLARELRRAVAEHGSSINGTVYLMTDLLAIAEELEREPAWRNDETIRATTRVLTRKDGSVAAWSTRLEREPSAPSGPEIVDWLAGLTDDPMFSERERRMASATADAIERLRIRATSVDEIVGEFERAFARFFQEEPDLPGLFVQAQAPTQASDGPRRTVYNAPSLDQARDWLTRVSRWEGSKLVTKELAIWILARLERQVVDENLEAAGFASQVDAEARDIEVEAAKAAGDIFYRAEGGEAALRREVEREFVALMTVNRRLRRELQEVNKARQREYARVRQTIDASVLADAVQWLRDIAAFPGTTPGAAAHARTALEVLELGVRYGFKPATPAVPPPTA